jgi:glutamate carboxypeptidase
MTVEAMLSLLRELVELESPTRSPGVRAVADVLARELAVLGADVRILEGDHLRADLPGAGPPLLLLGHADTVWPVGTLASMPFRLEGGRAYGPGAFDMKAGLVIMLAALHQARPRRGLRVFVTADEEIGSPTAKPLLEQAASCVGAALVLEPPTSAGHLKTARKGLGRFHLRVRGRAAHASGEFGAGANAIEEIARQIVELSALTDRDRGVSVNVGVVSGGTRENVVAAEAEALIDVRVPTLAERERIDGVLRSLRPKTAGTELELSGEWTRPPLERSSGSARLFAKAHEHGLALGLDLQEASSPGGSDGNLVGALGVPVLDGLGALGRGAHAADEHVVVDSLPVRARLLAELLRDPGV